jgi:hypothetical protein
MRDAPGVAMNVPTREIGVELETDDAGVLA